MIQALLHGKLSREQENMEDILTSNVFGLFRYLPPEAALLPFLAQAEQVMGESPLTRLGGSISQLPTLAKYCFWPRLKENECFGCEPDVLITLCTGIGPAVMVLVEAKYLSGKSSEADDTDTRPVDQLAREWDNLQAIACRQGAEPVLVYLTGDLACPVAEIRDSVVEYNAKRPGSPSPVILWLSWRQLSGLTGDSPVHTDLRDLARRLGLTYFSGFRWVEAPPAIEWCFVRPFRWNVNPYPFSWRFSA